MINSENTIKRRKKMTKINIETGITSDRIGSEKPVPAFQSRIACGLNPMKNCHKRPFNPPRTPSVNIGENITTKRLTYNTLQASYAR